MFSKGHKKMGGRRKGIPNRLVLKTQEDLWSYITQVEGQGTCANPLKILVDLMVRTKDDKIRITCAIALADRLLPKLKQMALTVDEPIQQYIVHLYGDEGQEKLNGSAHGPGTTPSPFQHERPVYED